MGNVKERFGLPPGSLIYVGKNKTHPVKLSSYTFNHESFEKRALASALEVKEAVSDGNVTWINVDSLADIEMIRNIGEQFKYHSLMLEDIVDTSQRPKLEDFNDYLFLTLKMLRWSDSDQKIYYEHVSFVLGSNYVISFQETPDDVFDPIRLRIEQNLGQVRKRGADFLFYCLLDMVVDHYSRAVEVYSEKIDTMEDKIHSEVKKDSLQKIQKMKKQVRFLIRTIIPLRDAVGRLDFANTQLLNSYTYNYFRDAHDHLMQGAETLEMNREILSGISALYHSTLSTNMNSVMKVLTIISTIFIPLTFIAGIYGMNFKIMPELEYDYGYPMVMGVMLSLSLIMLAYFRRKKWL